jgi:peptide/nickel transport system substrate-binding protein
MRMRRHFHFWRVLGALLVFTLVAAACGDDGDDPAAGTTTTMEPQSGGSITIAMFSETRGLDPTIGSGSGTAGGTEMIALYDTITRWNAETREYEMRTAESLTPNAAFDEWTLTLKPDIKFRDGTDYDAEAVRWNMERYLSAANTSTSRAWLNYVIGDAANVTVTDPLTVNFKLQVAYAGFPSLLGHTPGMILSPTRVQAALGDPQAADYRDKVGAFNLFPEGAGAGPFEIVRWNRGESIIMRKSPTYWGDEPYLDEIRFVTLAGSDASVEALRTGNVNVAFLRTPPSVERAKADASLGGIDSFIQAGGMLLMNRGVRVNCVDGKPEPACVGRPDGPAVTNPNTANEKVRRAAYLAIDPEVINQRVNDGLGIPSNGIFHSTFTDDPGVGGVDTDLAEARRLLEEAKAEGHSGKIRVTCTNQPERQALALALEAMLRGVGFDTEIRADIDTATQIGLVVSNRDFDLACWGLSLPNDDTGILALVQNFWSASPTNRVGYANPAWDAGLEAAMAAGDEASRKAAYETLAELWNQDLPSIPFEVVTERVAWQNKVHGVYLTTNTMFFLDKAWVQR